MSGHLQTNMRLPPQQRSCGAVRAARYPSVSVRATSTVDAPGIQKTLVNNSGAKGAALSKQVIADEKKYVLQTYGRVPIVISHGHGSKMWDVEGKEYLDLAAGIAVNALGHSDDRWYSALTEQAAKLAHTSNIYHTLPQVELAKRLVDSCFADKIFFCNTGTEANEAAIKFSRKHARVHAGIDPYDPKASAPHEIVSFSNCFHGRTMGALALTYKEQYRTPFQPLMPGTLMAPYNDLEAARNLIQKGKTCAVFVEPIQGEGGINVPTADFLRGLRQACDEAGALLVFDEVQCGLGRTGKLWGYQNFGDIEPDIMTVAKPLAGGLPIGAVLMKQHVADVMAPGDHGSTFAGNPLVCHTACSVYDVIADPAFLASVLEKGERLRAGLKRTMGSNKHVKDVRGVGLLCGVVLDIPAGPVTEAARDLGALVITAGKGDILRFVPPLVITNDEIDRAAEIMGQAIARFSD